jgi:hypothetical protein
MLNLGSSTRYFREVVQPYITKEVFAPLAANGVHVIHCDAKFADGIDIVGDVFDPDCITRMRETGAKSVLCSNMFEHVVDRVSLVRSLTALVPPEGWLLLTVPYSFPYHPDPIDTYFRPTPSALAELFEGWIAVDQAIVKEAGYYGEIWRQPWTAVRHAVRCLMPFYKPIDWPAAAHRWLWVARNYAVSCVSLHRAGN